jgi:transposase, IS30 family
MEQKKYKQLNITERELISILKAQNKSLREIALEIKRDPATISRELKRNAPPVHPGYYLAHKAQQRSQKRKSNAHQRPRLKNNAISAYVQQKLSLGWSPEQISGRLPLDHPGFCISHEAVYQYIYKEHPELISQLTRSHKHRHKKGHSRKHRKSHIPNRVSIQDRPQDIAARKHIGHWESDTVVSRQSTAALMLLLERKTRFALITKLHQKTAMENSQSIIARLKGLPQSLRQTITYDNGSENTDHDKVNSELLTRSYFCTAYHSWEKGSVENTAGLVRRIFPKKTDFSNVSASAIACVENMLNTRPRKCLNYLTPLEALANECVALNL